MSKVMEGREGISMRSMVLFAVDLLLFSLALLTWNMSVIVSCVSAVAVLLLTMGLTVRPAYAYYDLTHWGLTVKSIERLSAGGVTYSCWKEINKFLGPNDLETSRKKSTVKDAGKVMESWATYYKERVGDQGIVWGAIAEDYFGDGGDVDKAIVQNHYFNPATGGALTDWEGEEDTIGIWKGLNITGGTMAHGLFARNPKSAPERAQMHYEIAKKAYRHGSIRDAWSFLGRAVHLLEDMGVPAHTRNDNHLGYLLGLNFPEINDHLYWDSYEQWCDGVTKPVDANYTIPFTRTDDYTGPRSRFYPQYFRVSGSGEIWKYFPYCSPLNEFGNGKLFDPEPGQPPSWDRLWDPKKVAGIDSPLSETEYENAMSFLKNGDAQGYLVQLARDTVRRWWSDDTIPGNRTCPKTYDAAALGESESKTREMVGQGLILDAWKELDITEEEIEGEMEAVRSIGGMVSTRDMKDFVDRWIPIILSDVMQVPLDNRLEDESYSKYPWMRHFTFPAQRYKDRWGLLHRRRYRLKEGYLAAIAEDRFPVVTERAAAMIQTFYDNLEHVDVREDEEKKNDDGSWRNEKIVVKAEEGDEGGQEWKLVVWVENYGGVKDDFKVELGKFPEGWEVEVSSLSGCESVKGELDEGLWKGTLVNVDPTPEKVAEDGGVSSPWFFTSWYRMGSKYEKPFEGERGAKLEITIRPPKAKKEAPQ
ncbi:MAG TPA: hypothetical protein VM050_10425 [Patescibacteria group bacterium]|nr:hypothetical protein [Patescibacteria group bacterium]